MKMRMKIRMVLVGLMVVGGMIGGGEGQGEGLRGLVEEKEGYVRRLAGALREGYEGRCDGNCTCGVSQCFSYLDPARLTCSSEFGGDPRACCGTTSMWAVTKKRYVDLSTPAFRFSSDVAINEEALCYMQQVSPTFQEIKDEDKSLRFLYTASADGTMLVYPGFQQFECDEVLPFSPSLLSSLPSPFPSLSLPFPPLFSFPSPSPYSPPLRFSMTHASAHGL